MTRTRTRFMSAVETVLAWQSSQSAAKAAKICGIAPNAMEVRITRLRKKGVPVKAMRGPSHKGGLPLSRARGGRPSRETLLLRALAVQVGGGR